MNNICEMSGNAEPCPLDLIVGPAALLCEIVRVDLLDLVAGHRTDAQVVGNHQVRKLSVVNQHEIVVDLQDVFARIIREQRSGDHDAFLGSLALKSTREFLDLRTANACLPPLGLVKEDVEAETILFYYTVDTLATAAANSTCHILPVAIVPYLEEQLDD